MTIMTTEELESVIGGVYLALLQAFDSARRDVANNMLLDFARDQRFTKYEREFFSDLVGCAEMAQMPAYREVRDEKAH